MTRIGCTKAVATTALMLVATPALAAPKPLIDYFLPMPIVGKLSTSVWGAGAVGPRDPANGLEDAAASGGVGTGQEQYFYWDGKIVKGEDGKYHMYAARWAHSIGFGPPAGGSTGWETSIPVQAISDEVMGPYTVQGECYSKNQEGTDKGHNVTAVVSPSGANPYTLSVGEIVPGQMFGSSSANGPWTLLGLVKTSSNGHSSCGDLSSNFTLTIGGDNRFWATSRGGCVMDSDQVIGPYQVETNSILPNLEKNDNGDAEDEVIWYSGGYYHIVYNYWNVQRAYHIMSKDGVSNWQSTGLAYEGTQSPSNANSKWLRYTDGTVNTWHNMERPGVYLENGHVTHFTFAVTDTNKNQTGVSSGGSKVIVVPFDGAQFDCDNGDAASCGQGGASGSGGAAAGGAGGASNPGGGGGTLATGGVTSMGGAGGSAGAVSNGGANVDVGGSASAGEGVSVGVSGTGGSPSGVAGSATSMGGSPEAGGTRSNTSGVSDAAGCGCHVGASRRNAAWLGFLALASALGVARRRQKRVR